MENSSLFTYLSSRKNPGVYDVRIKMRRSHFPHTENLNIRTQSIMTMSIYLTITRSRYSDHNFFRKSVKTSIKEKDGFNIISSIVSVHHTRIDECISENR